MALSEKFEGVKFSKGVAGYSTKEVDAFFADTLPLIKEQEQIITSLRAKLGAFEAQKDEIAKKEHEAYRLLEAAKGEADIIVSNAKASAEKINDSAQAAANEKELNARKRAAELLQKAESEAETILLNAKQNSEKIIAAADARGKEMLTKAKAEHYDIASRAKELSSECKSFEESFRTLVADTARALASLNGSSRLPKEEPEARVGAKPQTVMPKKMQTVKKEEPVADTKEPVTEELVPRREEEHPEDNVHTDISFSGGKVIDTSRTGEKPKRHLFDTVTVTYDDDSDFEDIKNIMREGKMKKSPTHFSE